MCRLRRTAPATNAPANAAIHVEPLRCCWRLRPRAQFLQGLSPPRCCCLAGFLSRADLRLLAFLQEAGTAQQPPEEAAVLLLLLLRGGLGGLLLSFLQAVLLLLQLLQALLELGLHRECCRARWKHNDEEQTEAEATA